MGGQLGLAATDLDLYLLKGASVVASSQDAQTAVAGQVPFEILSYTATTSGTYSISVKRYSAPAYSGRVQVQRFGNGADLQFWNPEGSVGSPADSASAGMLTVGAANWQATSTVEPYSSQGPTTDNRVKPDLVGADCANTVTYGTNGFCGTSQASPHVTGLAALVRQRFPAYTAAQVVSYLKTNASARGAVPNNAWGFGLAFAPTIALPATKVAFTAQPVSASAGAPLSPLTVQVQDATSTLVATDNSTVVTVSKLSGPGSLTCLPATAIAGVATFSNCAVSAAGSYVLHAASSPVLTPADTSSFTVSPPAAAKLAFSAQPASGTVGVALTPLVVQVQDGSSAVVTGDNATIVTVTKSSGPGTLTCLPATAIAGVATFSNCTVSAAGSYTLLATSSPVLTPATSSTFVISSPVAVATKLAFSAQPASGVVGVALSPLTVQVQDAGSATVATDNSTIVTVTKSSGPGTLACLPATAIAGVATFSSCTVSTAGSYALLASSSPVLTPATSSTFAVAAPPATKLGFTQQPSSGTAGQTLPTQPVVTVQDATNTTVAGDNSTQVTLALTGAGGGVLSCTGGLTKTALSGVATFAGCSVSAAGLAYVLHATSSPALTAADSSAFVITGPATQLAFTQQPSPSTTGVPLATQPKVAVKDTLGTTVIADNATSVTLTLQGGAGVLSCTGGNFKTVVSGVATFSGCSVSTSGNYTLLATSSPVLSPATSSAFVISSPVVVATKLAFSAQPASGVVGVALSPLTVQVQDAGSAVVASDNSTIVTVTKSSGPGTLTCLPGTAITGVATFSNCTVSAAGSYTLLASSSPVLSPATSSAFVISSPVAVATKLGFTQQPSSGTAGQTLPTQPVVTVQDATSATVTTDNSTVVTLSLLSGPGTLSCTGGLSKTAIAGVATFSGCVASAAGSYQIRATSSPTLTQADGSAFVVAAPVGLAGTTWYFAEGFTGLGWTTELHLLNANASAATVAVTYLLDSGTPVTRNVSIPAQRELTLDASNLTVGPGPNVAFGVRITSDIAIVAEEQMYAGASGDFAHGTQGATALSNTWYFAEGFTQFGWQTFVLVANPGASAVDVTVTYQVQGGSPVTKLVTVAAGTRQTFLGHVDVPDQAFSVSVSSTGPVVAEMAMYDPIRTIAHRTVGVTAPASAWYLGEGFTGFGWETFIAVGNPGATDATVTATFTIDGGAPVVRVITVPAHSRGTFIAHDPTAGVGTGKAFGVFITSTAPVVVQEVLIDPVAGASRANSTMAASALASQWSFSGGSSNPGMVTFLTVSNPGLSSASVTATYYFNDGTAPATQLLTIPAQSRGTFASSSGIPANKTFGIVLTATGSLVVAQEAVYDESLHRAFSAAGAAGP